jgi:hypothetical protein
VQISSKTEAHSQKKTVRSSQAGTEITQKKVRLLGKALKTLGQSMNGEDFKKFVEEELLPKLWKGAW